MTLSLRTFCQLSDTFGLSFITAPLSRNTSTFTASSQSSTSTASTLGIPYNLSLSQFFRTKRLQETRTMNSDTIELSNQAVAHLQSGNIVPAFELLTKASAAIAMRKGAADHVHVDSGGNGTFRLHWEDCSRAGLCNKSTRNAWEGSTPFIFLQALRITISPDIKVDDLCPFDFGKQ